MVIDVELVRQTLARKGYGSKSAALAGCHDDDLSYSLETASLAWRQEKRGMRMDLAKKEPLARWRQSSQCIEPMPGLQ
eukprot:7247-Heterococcus_DN1.PRE.1